MFESNPSSPNSENTIFLVEDGASWYVNMVDEGRKSSALINEKDEIAVTLHAFMLELGFVNNNEAAKSQIPDNWRSPAGYITKYKFHNKSDFCVLNVTSMGKLLKVHGTNLITKETFSSSIKLSSYIRYDSPQISNCNFMLSCKAKLLHM